MADDAVEHARALFEALGLDAEADSELGETPERFTEFLREMYAGLDESPPQMSTFSADYAGDSGSREPVVLTALPFYSMCVHHVVPFFGTIDVAYLPDEQMTGFGSVGRVIDHYARRPQVQERLVNQIASHIDEQLDPQGVLVRCRARQMCMEMRGPEKTGTLIATAARGVLTDETRRARLLETFAREQETP